MQEALWFIELSFIRMKLAIETLKEEVHWVVLETIELESQEKTHAYASFGILIRSNFR